MSFQTFQRNVVVTAGGVIEVTVSIETVTTILVSNESIKVHAYNLESRIYVARGWISYLLDESNLNS